MSIFPKQWPGITNKREKETQREQNENLKFQCFSYVLPYGSCFKVQEFKQILSNAVWVFSLKKLPGITNKREKEREKNENIKCQCFSFVLPFGSCFKVQEFFF